MLIVKNSKPCLHGLPSASVTQDTCQVTGREDTVALMERSLALGTVRPNLAFQRLSLLSDAKQVSGPLPVSVTWPVKFKSGLWVGMKSVKYSQLNILKT